MGNMLPGNSFPQICVVSVNHSVENGESIQEYGRSMYLSNIKVTLKSNVTCGCEMISRSALHSPETGNRVTVSHEKVTLPSQRACMYRITH